MPKNQKGASVKRGIEIRLMDTTQRLEKITDILDTLTCKFPISAHIPWYFTKTNLLMRNELTEYGLYLATGRNGPTPVIFVM